MAEKMSKGVPSLQHTESGHSIRDARSLRAMTWLTTLCLPLSLFVCVGLPLRLWGVTALGNVHDFAWRLRFMIPESSSKITELDQAVALAGGMATLGFSCYHAWRSRGRREKP